MKTNIDWPGFALSLVYDPVCHLFDLRDKCHCRKENKEELKLNCPCRKLVPFFCHFLLVVTVLGEECSRFLKPPRLSLLPLGRPP